MKNVQKGRYAKPMRIMTCLLSLTALASCQTLGDFSLSQGGQSHKKYRLELSKDVDRDLVNTEPRKLTLLGIKALEDGDLDAAKAAFNGALKMNIRNSHLQFLNALTYHLRALNGNSQDFELAKTGYKLSQQFEPTNWLAVYYQGILHLDLKEYGAAQDAFARALMLDRHNSDILFHLAEASYYAHDVKSALGAIHKLKNAKLDERAQQKLHDISTMVYSAANMPRLAEENLQHLKGNGHSDLRLSYLEKRLTSWSSFHQRRNLAPFDGKVEKVQFALPEGQINPFGAPIEVKKNEPKARDDAQMKKEIEAENKTTDDTNNNFFNWNNQDDKSEDTSSSGFGFSQNSEDTEDREKSNLSEADVEEAENPNPMVVVDVVILRTEDDNSTSKGVNLLSGLKIQFGDPLSSTPTFSYSRSRASDYSDLSDTESTKTVTRYISIPSVSYSLNIANSTTGRNEILARPTLVAQSGETSEFFSGVEIAAAAVSGGDGDSVSIEKEVGVKLDITPEILENNFVRLDVNAERTFLTSPSSSVIFNYRLDTTKTKVNAAVTMRFGQTLIIGGLSEREKEADRDGVPFLQEIPGVQYLFSKATTRDYNKSVLILITPRRAQTIDQTPEEFEKSLAKLSKREREVEKLSYEFRDWFKPAPNMASVFQHMQYNDLYREFKMGDFPLESWTGQKGHIDRMRSVLPFLYY